MAAKRGRYESNVEQTQVSPIIPETIRAIPYFDPEGKVKKLKTWHLQIPVDSPVVTRKLMDEAKNIPMYYNRMANKTGVIPQSTHAMGPVCLQYVMCKTFATKFLPHLQAIEFNLNYNWEKIAIECLDGWKVGGVNMTNDVETIPGTTNPNTDRHMVLRIQAPKQPTRNTWGGNVCENDRLYYELGYFPVNGHYQLSQTEMGFVELQVNQTQSGKQKYDILQAAGFTFDQTATGFSHSGEVLGADEKARVEEAIEALRPYILDGDHYDEQLFLAGEVLVPQLCGLACRQDLPMEGSQEVYGRTVSTLRFIFGKCMRTNGPSSGTRRPGELKRYLLTDQLDMLSRPSLDCNVYVLT